MASEKGTKVGSGKQQVRKVWVCKRKSECYWENLRGKAAESQPKTRRRKNQGDDLKEKGSEGT